MNLTLILSFFVFMAIIFILTEPRKKEVIKKEKFEYIKQYYNNNSFVKKDYCLCGISPDTYLKINKICIEGPFINLSFEDYILYNDFFCDLFKMPKRSLKKVFTGWVSLSS